MNYRWTWTLSFAVIIGAASARAADTLIFDSFTPPISFGGFSSPNNGVATQLSNTQQLTISRIAVLNEMLSTGDLKFVILSFPQPQFLYISTPKSFPKDITGQTTWKLSDPLSFTFQPGTKYLVGYLRSVAVNENVDTHAESSAGITSDLVAHALSGYATPTYSHAFVTGADEGVRLYVLPEPSCLLLIAGAFLIERRPHRLRPRFSLVECSV